VIEGGEERVVNGNSKRLYINRRWGVPLIPSCHEAVDHKGILLLYIIRCHKATDYKGVLLLYIICCHEAAPLIPRLVDCDCSTE